MCVTIWYTAKTLKGRYNEYRKNCEKRVLEPLSYINWLEALASEYFWS